MILDVCCSTRKWKPHQTVEVVFGFDCLRTVSPDAVASFLHLPVKADSVDEVWADPPHLIRNDVKHWNPSYRRFGNWKNRREFTDGLRTLCCEVHRVLKPGGTFSLKLIYGKDYRVPHYADFKIVEGFFGSPSNWVEEPSKFGWSTNTTVYARYMKAS